MGDGGATAVTISQMLTSFGSVMTSMISIVTGNEVLYTILAGGLVAAAARVFKKIKNAVK